MSRRNLCGAYCAPSLPESVLRFAFDSLLFASSLLFCDFTSGQIISFDDQSLFLSQSGAIAEAPMPASGSTISQVVGGMTFTRHSPSTLFFDSNWTPLTAGNDLALNNDEEFNINFATPITSLGFEWVDVPAPDSSFDVTFLSGATVVGTANFSGPEDVLNFQGFVASQPFNRIEVRETSDDLANEYFGQFFTGALAKSWTNSGSGNWSTGTNWTGNTVPTATDFAFISPSTAVTVTGPAAATTVAGLTVDNQGGSATALNLQSSGALTVTNGLYLGQSGTSSLTVPSGGTLNVGGGTSISGQGTLNIQAGGLVSSAISTIGESSGSTASATVTGMGSTWNSVGLLVGEDGQGTLNVEAGGLVSNNSFGTIGRNSGSTGTVTVTGMGSTWNNSSNLFVGRNGQGTLNVEAGGLVSSNNLASILGELPGSTGTATVTGMGSTWNNNSSALFVGKDGQGTLNVEAGGLVSTLFGTLGESFGSTGTATVTGMGSTWTITSTLTIGNSGNGSLTIDDGALVSNTTGHIGFNTGSIGSVIVDGAGGISTWANSGTLNVGNAGSGTLNIMNGGLVSNTSGNIGLTSDSIGTATVTGMGSTWNNSGSLTVGATGQGTLNIEAGGQVSNTTGSVGATLGLGMVTVTGMGSSWTNSSDLFVGGQQGTTLNIEAGGQVTNMNGFLSVGIGQRSTATVTGTGSTWTNNGNLTVGGSSFATLNIEAGGAVSNVNGVIGEQQIGNTVTVTGIGSTWTNSGDLSVGGTGTGNLIISDQGLVEVGSTLNVSANSTVIINGGTLALFNSDALDVESGGTFNFNYGTLNFTSDLTVAPGDKLEMALGGSHIVSFGKKLQVDGTTALGKVLAIDGGTFSTDGLVNPQLLQFNSGALQLTGVSGLTVGTVGIFGAAVTVKDEQTVSVTNTATVDAGATLEVRTGGKFAASTLANSGQIRGTGVIEATLANGSTGEVFVGTGEQLRVLGAGHTNAGQFTLGSGTLNFDGDVTNQASGLIFGNGTYRADGGTANDGTMALSATSNVIGDVTNNAAGQITVTGGTTTFFDDMTNDGTLQISEGATAVFFGSLTGAQGTTGSGGARMEGDLKPGSSPGTMSFGGDLSFGPAAGLEIELGGLLAGSEYDRVEVADFASLGGTLDVSLINGFEPNIGDTFGFLFAAGGFDGTFDTLNLPDIGPGKEWLLNPGGLTVFLEVRAAFTADFDLDGDVDGDDLNQWQGDYGVNGFSDADSDGDSDGRDFLAWQRQFGSGVPAGSASSRVVPEPTTWWILCSGIMAWSCQKRSQRSFLLKLPRRNKLMFPRIISVLGTMATIFVFAASAVSAQGISRTWSGPNGGSWNSSANWSPVGSPHQADFLTVNSGQPDSTGTLVAVANGGQILIRSTSSVTMGSLWVGSSGTGHLSVIEGASLTSAGMTLGRGFNSVGVATVSGTGSDWDVTDFDDEPIGQLGSGTLNILAGGNFDAAGGIVLGDEPSGIGTINLAGAASDFRSVDLTLGRAGTGVLEAAAGVVRSDDLVIGEDADSFGRGTLTNGSTWNNAVDMNIGVLGDGTLEILSGSTAIVFGAANIGLMNSGRGEVLVEGISSHWDIAGKLTAADIGTATINIRNGAALESTGADVGKQSGSNGTINIGGVGSTWTDSGTMFIGFGSGGEGRLNITAGGIVSTTQAVVGFNGGSMGHAVVDGSGSVWNVTSNALQVGSGGDGTIDVTNGGKIIAATNLTIANGSSASGDVTVDGIGSELIIGTNLTVGFAGAGTLTLDHGGRVTVAGETSIGSGDTLTLNDGSLTTAEFTKNGTLAFNGGTFEIRGGDAVFNSSFIYSGEQATAPEFRVVDGGDAAVTLSFQVGNAIDEYGSAMISGVSSNGLRRSTLRGTGGVSGVDLLVGNNGTGTLTVADGALANFHDDFILGLGITGSGTASVTGTQGSFRSTVDVTSGGSTSLMILGSNGDGELSIADGALVAVGGDTYLGQVATASGKLTIGGSSDGFDATLDITGGMGVGGTTTTAGGTGELIVNSGGLLAANGTVRVWDNGSITLDGGTITALGPEFVVESGGAFDWRRGTLTLNLTSSATFSDRLIVPSDGTLDTDATINGSITALPGSTINLSGDATLGQNGTFGAVELHGALHLNGNTLTVKSSGFTQLGVLTTTNNSTINAPNGIALGAGDSMTGTGAINGPVAASAGSTISGAVVVGDAGSPIGFHSDGVLNVPFITTIHDANLAELGALTTLGSFGFGGVLNIANGAVFDFADNLTGFGTVASPNDSTKPIINNGSVAGNSAAQPITFNGHVKGVGTFANIVFNGTFSPGLSPAAIDAGDLAFGNSGVLEIELGGLTAGSGFDQINSDGVIDLGGTLHVDLISDFMPSLGDTFEIINAESFVDTFDVEDLPDLGGFLWDVSYGASSVTLAVVAPFTADFDLDGDVDGDDLTDPVDGWQARYGSDLDGGNFLDWQRQFGRGVPPLAASTSVPEPSSMVLLVTLATACVLQCRKLKGIRALQSSRRFLGLPRMR